MSRRKREIASQRIVQDHGIPIAVGFAELVKFIEAYRGTSIRFIEDPALDGNRVCGAWTGDGVIDEIHLPSQAKLDVKFFIACHEFGHMLTEIPGEERLVGDDPEIVKLLGTVLNPKRRVAYAFARSSFSEEQEALAESIGDQLALRVLRARRQSKTRDFKFEQVFSG